MDLAPGDLVLVRVNVPDPDHHRIADKWEQSLYRVIEKLNNQLVFRVQEISDDDNVKTLHHNMLFPILTEDRQLHEGTALAEADLFRDCYFDPYW